MTIHVNDQPAGHKQAVPEPNEYNVRSVCFACIHTRLARMMNALITQVDQHKLLDPSTFFSQFLN